MLYLYHFFSSFSIEKRIIYKKNFMSCYFSKFSFTIKMACRSQIGQVQKIITQFMSMNKKDLWEVQLNIKKPATCKRKALCCKVATSVRPWEKLANVANNPYLKDFFNIFIPYPSAIDVKKLYPEAYDACMKVAKSRNINPDDIVFYKCRFLVEPSHCPIYEDRPSVCRRYPDSPFDAIPSICGYHDWSEACIKKTIALHQELYALKLMQFGHYPFFILSGYGSWLR